MFDDLDVSTDKDLQSLAVRLKALPRVHSFEEVDVAKVYLGWTAMPPERAMDMSCRKALYGPFENREAAEEASKLLREFCHACGTGLIMGDVFTGDGQKFNNSLVMNVAGYIQATDNEELSNQPRPIGWSESLKFPSRPGETK